jgi:YVTN family beta-propeller protein
LNAAPSAVIATQSRSYALTPANGTVHLLDGDQLRKTGSIRLGDHIDSIRLTPDGRRLVGISGKSREMVVADVESGKQLHRFELDYEPLDFDLQVHAESKAVYAAISGRTVGDGATGTAEFIDLTNRRRRRVELNGRLGDIRFRLDGALALVANYDEHSLVAIDTGTAGVICEIALAMRPENLCFGSQEGQLFVSGSGMDGIAIVFPYRTLDVDQTLLAGHAPGAMVCSDTPSYLFVASRAGSEISIVDIDSRKVIAVVQAGQMPNHITITPDQQYALVLNEASGDMAVIRITTITANRRKSGASLFSMVPVGAKPIDTAIVSASS